MRCETRISPITSGQRANAPYTRQSRTPTRRSEAMNAASPTNAIAQSAPRRRETVNGATRNAGERRPDQVVTVVERRVGAWERVLPVEQESFGLGVQLVVEVERAASCPSCATANIATATITGTTAKESTGACGGQRRVMAHACTGCAPTRPCAARRLGRRSQRRRSARRVRGRRRSARERR